MGFDVNRFRESDVKEEFICPICHDILEDPVLLDTCEHVFCSQCINEWLQKCEHKLCPIDRQEINDKNLRPPQRSFRNLITSLLISCDFQDNGCQESVKIECLSTHSSKCSYNPEVMDQNINCPTNCGAIVKRSESIGEHNCVVYLKDIIEEKNTFINELLNKNLCLLEDNNRMNSELIELMDKYEDSVKRCQQLSTDLVNSNENNTKLDEKNCFKDMTINSLETQLKNMSKKYELLTINNRNVCHNSDTDGLDLISFECTGNPMNSDNSELNETLITTSVENRQLIAALSKREILVNKRVTKAMLSIDRGLFAPSAASYALHHIRSIGYGAHTGPATYEATVLQHLESLLIENCNVLDIGSGTGYLTACIASMIEPKGRVVGIEHIPQLVQQSIETIDKLYPNLKQSGVLKICLGDGRLGYASEAPYDLIFIEPLTRRMPQRLIDQLRPGGSIVVPIGAREKDINLELFTKKMNGEVVRQVLNDDWKLMQENTPDLFDDKKLQLRSGWKSKLGF